MVMLDYFRCRYLKQNVHTKRHASLSTYHTGPYFHALLSNVCAPRQPRKKTEQPGAYISAGSPPLQGFGLMQPADLFSFFLV